ncbi:ABC transporter permease [Hydrogenovibrio kuenenii]|uniref:ABC transporter permease n=1 Tax=Hydrogenovibrio kuenenii TaxID=63658 RepID=UPI000463086C|nr:ABC transporter permease [Hydrogenovibrio kuenenii]
MFKRILILIHARNLEFFRDKASLGWSVAMPFFLVFALALAFYGDNKPLFKVAVYQPAGEMNAQLNPIFSLKHVHFYAVDNLQTAINKVARHQTDLLINLNPSTPKAEQGYWVNDDSPNGYMMEKLLKSLDAHLKRHDTENHPIKYIDWVIPGVLGMNIMFGALFGVGFVIVRYRRSGYLKRLNATPLKPVEFILAQLISRLFIVVFISAVIFMVSKAILGFAMNGSYWALLFVTVLGSMSMIAMSLMVTARVSSEELAGGLLNLLTWPMMLLSGVWFSLDGSYPPLKYFAQLFPLTHMLEAVRAITIDGKGLVDLTQPIIVLSVMTALFIAIGAYFFKWSDD